MKKFIAILLGAMLVMSVTACGSKTGDSASAPADSEASNGSESAAAADITYETEFSGDNYALTVTCPTGGTLIAELPEESEEITEEDQAILDLYAEIESLNYYLPVIVTDEVLINISNDYYDYPYHSTNMEEFYQALDENGSWPALDLVEINGRKAIVQDTTSSIIVRVESDNEDMYFEFTITPNIPDALEAADGNMADSAFVTPAREILESDAISGIIDSITVKKK